MKPPPHIENLSILTGDFDELSDGPVDWDQDYSQISPGDFVGSLELSVVGEAQIMRERWNQKIRYRGLLPDQTIGFGLPMSNASSVNWLGQRTDKDAVFIQGSGREGELISQNWDALVLSFPEKDVTDILSALTQQDVSGEHIHGICQLSDASAERIRVCGSDIRQASTNVADPEGAENVARLTEQFLREFLWTLVKAQEDTGLIDTPTKPRQIVKQATDFALAHQREAIGLTEICMHLGVSMRALHYAFEHAADMSPATWLRRIRLNKVRKSLSKASKGEVLIKQIAAENGFLHVGHFSDQYRRLFGCLPSDTLEARQSSL